MKSIINDKAEQKYLKKLARKEWWFKITKLKHARKVISKEYYKEHLQQGKAINQIYIYASDFKKLSKEQIEYALNLFVKYGEIYSFKPVEIDDSKDVYLVVFFPQNRSQERILRRIPEEIDLNDIQLEPLPQNEQEKSAQTEEMPTKQSKQEESTTPKRKSVWDD